ncbi:transporter [Rhodanobacter thiooxydans]|uniref:Transporter n=1 Tax=Rhodanobacter thiooxydans TaxID=416169 RepID=A0A154QHH9_9GAMM|nr:YeeE/YedE thiosulfate transporter family protein [Rhodanobacter thiooxydans]KZC23133.1 transporter [Rhodanobacter thiooxydans]MCW0201113.1 YeeE/YedE family protein [Rhodanobacter thiooxydans]
MTFPLGWTTPLSGIVFGVLFGFVLQRGGLGNGCRLSAQLRLKDWTVFNVMFTAIIVAAGGLYLMQMFGLVKWSELFVPTTFLWATLLGGALIGAGMAVGGYCPGTSVVGATAGRIDGIVFFVGLVVGVVMFAGIFGDIEPFLTAAPGPQGQTLGQLLHIPDWLVLVLLVGGAVLVGWLSRRIATSNQISCAD